MNLLRGEAQGQQNSSSEYSEVNRLDGEDSSEQADTTIQCIEVRENTDVIQTKDELRKGNIVLADISNLRSGMTKERVGGELTQTVEDIGGDIAEASNVPDLIILSPYGVGISRTLL